MNPVEQVIVFINQILGTVIHVGSSALSIGKTVADR